MKEKSLAPAIETSLSGQALMDNPSLNKGTAFTLEERRELGILGLLPDRVETLDEQVTRAYEQYNKKPTPKAKNIYLNAIRDNNEVLFYRLLKDHPDEMIPIVYTPVEADIIENYSHVYRRPRGIYLSYDRRDDIDAILDNRPFERVDAVCVTDAEGVLGIGDQGVGGAEIPAAKLMLYSLCAGIDPATTLPILLDVGTNNEALLNDPFYLGIRRKRLTGKEYDDFVDNFVSTLKRKLPNVFLHFEDFGRENARSILDRYRSKTCVFNDDQQGTGAVALAVLRAGLNAIGSGFASQRVVIFGAGTAGTGIADMICLAAMEEGVAEQNARKMFWLIDTNGLIHEGSKDVTTGQRPYARTSEELSQWHMSGSAPIGLEDVVKQVHPTILIGTSKQPRAFTERIVRDMAAHTARPIIFPLSNPTSLHEAIPADILAWTDGKAVIATGSPFEPVPYGGKIYSITECNNFFFFPGLALGAIASGARLVTDGMIIAGAKALGDYRPASADVAGGLLPELSEAVPLSERVALAVGVEALKQGLAAVGSESEILSAIKALSWSPQYRRIKKKR
ncbi:NAD-dependent malic enzyme [Candidatus Magnetominusculus dajiuhuensis]|uniref:NAD-dependent malic enzyme n=1 Tax=Candidatus Magnetominusculus dajiuhuensis TaxID=3137712 RepID=UPI003B43D0FC